MPPPAQASLAGYGIKKASCLGQDALHSLVEPEGFEPSSKHVTNKLSTRLFCLLIVGPQPEDRHPNCGLSYCFLSLHRNTAGTSLIWSRLPDPALKARTGGNRMLLIYLIRQPLQSCSYCHLKVDGRDLRGNQQSPTCLLTDLPRCQNQSTPVTCISTDADTSYRPRLSLQKALPSFASLPLPAGNVTIQILLLL